MDELYDEAEYPTRTAIIKALRRMEACEDSLQFMSGMTTWQEAWDKCQMGSWMSWYLRWIFRIGIKDTFERSQAINKLLEIEDSIEKDQACGCGCGLNLYFGPESEKKLAAVLREHYVTAPDSPADLAKHERFDAYFSGCIDFTST